MRGAQQQLQVEVNGAKVPEGTVMTITATIGDTVVTLGTAVFHLNGAEFKLNKAGMLPAGVASLSDITTISVSAPGFFTLMGMLP